MTLNRHRLRALSPEFSAFAAMGPGKLEIWITPPAYTGVAPIFLTAGKEQRDKGTSAPLLVSNRGGPASAGAPGIKGPIAIPEGSMIIAQLSGGWGKPKLLVGTEETEFKSVADGTYIFALPGSPGACRDAWLEILRFQLDSRLRPCNLVELMPRLREHL